MKRESHLFACHKFLEEVGANILIQLAKADFRDLREIEGICNQIENLIVIVRTIGRQDTSVFIS